MSEWMITQADNGRSLDARQGDTIRIRLEENPTTGYQWAVEHIDADVVTLQSSGFSESAGAGIGGGGCKTWVLQGTGRGTAQVRLKLWREWEGDASITDRFRLSISVQG